MLHKNSFEYGYTPKLSKEGVFALRRLAWLKRKPMTKTLDEIVKDAIGKVDIEELCKSCKGIKIQCSHCVIKEGVAPKQGKPTPKP